jgi:hypothetical protein
MTGSHKSICLDVWKVFQIKASLSQRPKKRRNQSDKVGKDNNSWKEDENSMLM